MALRSAAEQNKDDEQWWMHEKKENAEQNREEEQWWMHSETRKRKKIKSFADLRKNIRSVVNITDLIYGKLITFFDLKKLY